MKTVTEPKKGRVYADRIRAYCECGREIVWSRPPGEAVAIPYLYKCECGEITYLEMDYPYWNIGVEEKADREG